MAAASPFLLLTLLTLCITVQCYLPSTSLLTTFRTSLPDARRHTTMGVNPTYSLLALQASDHRLQTNENPHSSGSSSSRSSSSSSNGSLGRRPLMRGLFSAPLFLLFSTHPLLSIGAVIPSPASSRPYVQPLQEEPGLQILDLFVPPEVENKQVSE